MTMGIKLSSAILNETNVSCIGHLKELDKFIVVHKMPPYNRLKTICIWIVRVVFNKLGVAGAVLQTPLSVIN